MNTILLDKKSFAFIKDKHFNFVLECYDYLQDIVPFDGENVFVSGGFFPRRFIGAPLRDIDVYVYDKDNPDYLDKVVEEYRRLDWNVEQQVRKGYDSENQTLHHLCSKDGEPNIDLIGFHKPKSILTIETFDLNIVQMALTENHFYFVSDYIFDLLENRQMHFTGNICTRTFERIIKYTKLGYSMEEEQLCEVRKSFFQMIELRYLEKQKKEEDKIPPPPWNVPF